MGVARNYILQEQNRELEAIRLTEVKKAAQKGLKSKFERDVEIQDEIEHYKSVLSGEKGIIHLRAKSISNRKPTYPTRPTRSEYNKLLIVTGKQIGRAHV